MSSISTTANYDDTLDRATQLLDERVDAGTLTFSNDSEREKTIADTLNNTWVDGITVAEWVDTAAGRLGV